MRRLLVVLSILGGTLLGRDASAQAYATDRDVWKVGGTARFTNYHVSGNDGTVHSFVISPDLGYFVTSGLAITANVLLAHSWSDGSSATQYGVGPGLTYYFLHRTATANPYLKVNTLFIHSSFPGATIHDIGWSAAAGLALFVARNVAITGELFYSHWRTESESNGLTSSGSSEQYGAQFGMEVFAW
jgi:hypothetical protein